MSESRASMKEIKSVREIQLLELEILKQFKQFCEKNQIKYYLLAGTLLGAVRHGGFIPWDDDIDVAVLREDYDKLLRLLKKDRSLGSKKFYVHIPGDKGYRWPFIKIVNKNTVAYEEDHYKTEIWIDVFPMDFLANTKEERQKIYKKIVKYNYFAHLASYDWNFCRFICPKKLALQYVRWKLLHFIGAEFFVKRISEGKFFGKQGKDYVGCVVYPIDPEKDKYSIEAFKKSIEVKFEDETFPIPSGFDEMLTNFYGDYMTPPPEKDRNGHKIRAYYISDRT